MFHDEPSGYELCGDMDHTLRPLVEGKTGPLESIRLGYRCMALWKPSGPIYAFNGTNQKVAEIPRPTGYLYALGRGADETILVPTISGFVYRFDMDGHLVETVTLDIPMHLLAVAQLPDGRYLACIGDRQFGLDVTPSFVLFDRSGKFKQLALQRQSYDPQFEVLLWGDVLVSDCPSSADFAASKLSRAKYL